MDTRVNRALRAGFIVLVPLVLATFPAPGNAAGPTCLGADPTIEGTPRNDVLFGGPGADVIDARGGDDFIQGGDGEDLICGRSGNDLINGDEGSDVLDGASGDDSLDGGDDGASDDVDHANCASGSDGIARIETTDGRCET